MLKRIQKDKIIVIEYTYRNTANPLIPYTDQETRRNVKDCVFLPFQAGSLGVRDSIPLSSTKKINGLTERSALFVFGRTGIESKGV